MSCSARASRCGWPGPELTFFCNEAYRRDTLGRRYPWALGRSAREVWAEIWPDIGPRIETVMNTGTATWDEALLLFLERSGYVEETYHTFSYSSLTDDEGRIVGVSVTVDGIAERFPSLPTGAWDEPPTQALVVPLPQQGQVRPYGFLVVGLNRYRPLDAGYRRFIDLVAGQLGAGIASARAYEAERRRAETLAELDRAKTAAQARQYAAGLLAARVRSDHRALRAG